MPTQGIDLALSSPIPARLARLVTWLAIAIMPIAMSAADKSGVGPNAVSLPAGPGSIEGLGESFEPSLNTGTARYGINLVMPNGTAGNTPSLRLSYDGGAGNGPIGFGWDLVIPYIQRQTDKGIPRYIDGPNEIDDDHDGEFDEPDELDRFINESKEELVPVPGGFHFCENEDSFIRYRRLNDHWEATTPDGTRLDFGLTPNGRVMDPNSGRVFKWLLERRTDTRGNVILFHHADFPGDSNRHQKYLRQIIYGPGAPPWLNAHFAHLIYEDRSDWFEDGRPGFIVRTGKRLKEILIGTQGPALPDHRSGDFNEDGLPDHLVRKYAFDYLDDAAPNAHWSLLHTVQLIGADGLSTQPPARFDYNVCNPPLSLDASSHWTGGLNEPQAAFDNPFVDLLDLNGDGLPDLLRTEAQGGAHRVFLNLGEANTSNGKAIRWDDGRQLDSADGLAWNVDLASETTIAYLADMNGDGLADLTYRSAAGDVHYFANTGRLAWEPRQPMTTVDVAPPSPHGEISVLTADLDFDKRIDVIQSIDNGLGVDYRIWLNLGNQRFSKSVTIPQSAGFSFSQQGVRIADFNGDGVPDIGRIRPSSLLITAGLGHGHFAEPMTVMIPDFVLDDVQVGRAQLQDVTGDGLVDLVIERAVGGQLWYWINLGNYTLSPRHTIHGMPTALGPNPTTRWADLNGNGTTDLLYADSSSVPRIVTVDLGELMGCVPKPNLLTRIENGIGRITHIEYAPSTRFALADLAANRPWPHSLPFPISVVSRVVIEDSLGHAYVTEFRYHDGYYDGAEKEFRGFAHVEQVLLGDPTAPTLINRSRFHTGHDYAPLKGKLLRRTAEQDDGQVFWRETIRWTTPPRTLHTGLNGQTVQYAPQLATTKSILELGRGTPRQIETETHYDDLGNLIHEANYGIVENGNPDAMDDERIVHLKFAVNTNAWILRAPWLREITDEHGTVISRTEHFYDDETFSGLNPGHVTVGNLTSTRSWIDPANPDSFVQSARTKYDIHGNGVLSLDPLAHAPNGNVDLDRGHCRTLTYDERFHTYPIRETVHVGHGSAPLVMEADYNAGFGVAIAARDFNGIATCYGYDPFGRLTRMIRSGDSEQFPSTEYAYVLAQPLGPDRSVNYIEARLLDKEPDTQPSRLDHYYVSRQFIDGLGRKLFNKSEAEPATPGGPPRAVVQGAVRFNARQDVVATLNPYFSLTSGSSLEELLAFEHIEAPGWQGLFHQDGDLVPLDLESAHQTVTEYDALGRTILLTFQDGAQSRTVHEPLLTRSYDENDLIPASPHLNTPVVAHRDGLGRHVQTDEWVRLTNEGAQADELQCWSTHYQFDLNDRLIRITDAQNNVKTMTFDGLQRLVALSDPDAGMIQFVYDAASNHVESRDAKQQRITFTYDGANRLLTEDYHDESEPFSHQRSFDPTLPLTHANRPDVAFFYDSINSPVDLGDGRSATARNLKGRLAVVWDLSGEEHSSYDERGRVEWLVKRLTVPDLTVPTSYFTGFDYDALDRMRRVIYPDNDEIAYAYNERNLLDRILGGPTGTLLELDQYLPSAQNQRTRFGNGTIATRTCDPRQRTRSLRIVPRDNPADPFVAFDYEFDDASNLIRIGDLRPEKLVPAGSPRRNTQRFEYDDLYRLTRVAYLTALPGQPDTGPGEIRYRYDRIGNLVSQISNLEHVEQGRSITDLGEMSYGGHLGAWNRIGRPDPTPGPHALSSRADESYQYDLNGNVVTLNDATCTWDFQNRLVAFETAEMRAEYVYDHADRRVLKRVTSKSAPDPASTITLYVNQYFEIRDHEQPTKYVWNGPVRVARATGSLSSRDRHQRVALVAGWNLCATAVNVPQTSFPSSVQAAFRIDTTSGAYQPILPDEPIPAGTILWIKSSGPELLTLKGDGSDAHSPILQTPGGWWIRAGSVSLDVPEALLANAVPWHFNNLAQTWSARPPDPLPVGTLVPDFVAPGSAMFVHSTSPLELPPPDPTLDLYFYHPDHLGSVAVITDAAGHLVEESSYYPFGLPRHEFRPRKVADPYQYGQKEQDRESGLHYFEARFLAAEHGRFLSPDPLYLVSHALAADAFEAMLQNPQALNLYAYTQNNPLKYRDPSGLSLEGLLDDVRRAVGLKAEVAQSGAIANAAQEIQGVARTAIRTAYDDANMDRTVFSGHGDYPFNHPANKLRQSERDLIRDRSQYFEVPEGTTITFYATHGMTISDRLGNAIERNKVPTQQFSETYGPGELIPNYRLMPPVQPKLHVKYRLGGGNVTVTDHVLLEDLLKPNMGPVDWAACLHDPQYGPASKVPKADFGNEEMLLHKAR